MTALSPPERSPGGWAPSFVLVGLGLAIVFGSVQFWMLGIGTEDFSGSVATRGFARAIVYGSLLVAFALLRDRLWELTGPTLLPLWLFSVATCLTALFTDSPLAELERTLWFSGFLLLTASAALVAGWLRFLTAAAVTGTILVGAGVIGHVTGWTPAYITPYFDGGVIGIERAQGLQAASNDFARTTTFVAMIGIILLLQRQPGAAVRLVGVASAVTGVAGLVLSQARVPTVALIIAVSLVLVRRTKRVRLLALPLGIVAIGIFFRVVSTGDVGVGARSELSTEADTFLGRTPIWAEAVRVWSDHPFTGIGIESLQAHYSSWTNRGLSLWDPANAHNALMQALAAHGIVPAALLLFIGVSGLAVMVRHGRTGAAELMVLFLIQCVTEAVFTGNPEYSVAIVVGLLTVGTRATAVEEPVPQVAPPEPVYWGR